VIIVTKNLKPILQDSEKRIANFAAKNVKAIFGEKIARSLIQLAQYVAKFLG
jgi:hypothetical protein